METIRPLSTGAARADVRSRIRRIPLASAPFRADLSLALDELVIQMERRPGRWKTRILRLRKLILERRAMGRAGS